MQTALRNVAGAMLVAVAALQTGWPQSASQELSLSDIRAQQPPESIYASIPCKQASENPRGTGMERFPVYPITFVPYLKTLMERSDEVILAANLDGYTAISPNGKSTARYEEVRIIHSWKGAHPAGATLTFGTRGGLVECSPNHGERDPVFSAVPRGKYLYGDGQADYFSVLFLRHAQGEETQLVQGFLPAAGEGLQGVFQISTPYPYPPDAVRLCGGVFRGNSNVEECYGYLRTITSPVMMLYAFDPLAAKYYRKPALNLIEEIETEADSHESAQKLPLR